MLEDPWFAGGQWQQRPSCLGDDIGVTEAGRPMWPAPSQYGWSLAGSPGSGDQLVGLQVLCRLVFMTPAPDDQPEDMLPLSGKLEFRRLKSQRVVPVDGPKHINKARRWYSEPIYTLVPPLPPLNSSE